MTQAIQKLGNICVSCVLAAITGIALISAAVLAWTQFS